MSILGHFFLKMKKRVRMSCPLKKKYSLILMYLLVVTLRNGR